MVKAHSLLYAIYICLIISILCGALLYIANLYNQLNNYYVTRDDLYIHNQSLVNYGVYNLNKKKTIEYEETLDAIGSEFYTKQYGLLVLVVAKSFIKNDTIMSAHLAGANAIEKTCLYLTDFDKPLSYSGTVKINGNKFLPSDYIKPIYINNAPNKLINKGKTLPSGKQLPELNNLFKNDYNNNSVKTSFSSIEKENDSIYFNSFFKKTKEILLDSPILSDIILKGNFILSAKDSIYIKKTSVLEDVILIAPKIIVEDGFSGNIQAFATDKINIGKKVTLLYPSILSVNNTSAMNEATIKIQSESFVQGALLLYGFPFRAINKNLVCIEKGSYIAGDIFCEGRLNLKGNVYGSVYTNKFLLETSTSKYENCISDIEIDVNKRPDYFISFPVLNNKNVQYEIIKKVM